MCGLWCTVGRRIGREVLDPVRSRGPDGEGWREIATPAGPVVLGHRRLAIYDLSDASAQPFESGDGRFVVVFNGAIYNFQDLRRELEARRVEFRTAGDTEVLVEAWRVWGSEALDRFDGMFAFLLLDRRELRLHAVRDRLGEKPLLSASDGRGAIHFGSDLRQFRRLAEVDWRLDEAAAARFLNYGEIDRTDRTLVRGVRRVPAGSRLELDLSSPEALAAGLSADPRRWWLVADRPAPADAADPQALRARLIASVRTRMVADVPSGVCLSGGLDSTIVARTAAAGGASVACVSAVFEARDAAGRDLSEAPFVAAAVEGAPLTVFRLSPSAEDTVDALDRIVGAQGEPIPTTSVCVQWFVFREARARGLKVMLDGQGADELFGGYPSMLGAWLADRLRQGPLAWARGLEDLIRVDPTLDRRTLVRATWAAAPERSRIALRRLRGDWPPRDVPAPGVEPSPREDHGGAGTFDRLSRRLLAAELLPSLLRFEDRNSMAHGVETRLPFLAAEVIDAALAIPAAVKVRGGWRKDVLRQAFWNDLPPAVRDRRSKLGFVAPHDVWAAGALGDRLREILADAEARRVGPARRGALSEAAASVGASGLANERAFRYAAFVRWRDLYGL